jgi:CHAT domain-containing protein/tetratricopeptide (TPR) repeat protein
MRGHNAVSALAAILAAVALVVLSSVSHAGEQEAGALIERSRAAMAAGDKVSIRTLVRADRSAAYEAVHRLGAEGSESALRLAETIAAAYAEIYSDRRLVERMPQFRAWTPEERKERASAVAMKADGRAAYADGRPEDALQIMETACATFDRIHDEREGAWCANALAGLRAAIHKGEGAIQGLQEARDAVDRVGDIRLLGAVESNLALAYRGAGDLVSARRELEHSVQRARDLGDRREEAARTVTLALVENEQGDVDAAVAGFRRAITLARETGESATEALAWNNLGTLHRDLGSLPEAIAEFRKSYDIARRIGQGGTEADSATSLALILREQGRDAEARVWLKRAESLAAQAQDTELRGRVACVKTMTLIEEGNASAAMPILDEAVAEAREAGDPGVLAFVLECRAYGLFSEGRYEEAVAEQRGAVEAAVQSSDGSSQAWRRQILAYHLALMGDFAGASRELETAVRLHAERKSGLGRCRAIGLLGAVHEKAGDHVLARQELEEAVRCAADAGEEADRANSLVDLARLDLKAGPSGGPEALARAQEAARINRDLKATPAYTECQLLVARAHLLASNPENARKVLDELAGLGRAKRGLYNEWSYQYLRARVAIAQGNHPAAILACERAVAEAEAIRSHVRPPPWRAALLEERIEPYRELVRLYLDDGSIEKAYRVARLAKAREFALKLLPPSLDGDERVAGGPAGGTPSGSAAPAAMKATMSSRPERTGAPLAELRALLHPREALLDYFVLNDRVVAFVVRKDSVKARRLPLDGAALRTLAETARFPGRPVPEDAPVTETWRGAMARLGEALLGPPIAADLAETDTLLIVPNLWLHSVPMAALPFEGRPLLERRVVAILPSADALLSRQLRRSGNGVGGNTEGQAGSGAERTGARRTGVEAALLGLGDPEIEGRGSRLPGAAAEVRRVAALVAGPSWIGTGPDASEAAYRERAPRSRLIHLAAHGRIDSLVPSRSRIELAGGQKADGRLTAGEIAALPLCATLVTLSGCGTGEESGLARGDAPGDEREGLPRAFLAAGARTVVASLWEMDDAVASEVFPQIYRSLGARGDGGTMNGPGRTTNSDDPTAALAAVQRSMLSGALKLPDGRALDHPFYWAGIVAYGAGGSR